MKLFSLQYSNLSFILFLIFIKSLHSHKLQSDDHKLIRSQNLFISEKKNETNQEVYSHTTIVNDYKNFTRIEGDKLDSQYNKYTKLFKRNNRRSKKEKMRNLFFGDIMSSKRSLTFHISRVTECTVLVTDIVTYKLTMSNLNFVEHIILNNNSEQIDIKSVTSQDIKITDYSYNTKMNMFIVYFDSNAEKPENFSVIFQYEAKNLIKTVGNPEILDSEQEEVGGRNFKQFKNFKNLNSTRNIENNHTNEKNSSANTNFLETKIKSVSTDPSLQNNSLVWKIYNKNFNSEDIEIKLIFDLGKDFVNYFIHSRNNQMKFIKKIHETKEKSIVEYDWSGENEFYSVIVMDVNFPLYFENCRYDNMSIFAIVLGSVLVTLMTLMIYIILSSIIKGDI